MSLAVTGLVQMLTSERCWDIKTWKLTQLQNQKPQLNQHITFLFRNTNTSITYLIRNCCANL